MYLNTFRQKYKNLDEKLKYYFLILKLGISLQFTVKHYYHMLAF